VDRAKNNGQFTPLITLFLNLFSSPLPQRSRRLIPAARRLFRPFLLPFFVAFPN
jgi:hypothetical protein